MECWIDGEGLPGFAIIACEVMETSSGRPRAPSPYFVLGWLIGTCSWDEKRRLLGLCNVDTALSEIGSSKDVLTLHGISNPSDSLCALCMFRLGSPDFACNVLLLHPRIPANRHLNELPRYLQYLNLVGNTVYCMFVHAVAPALAGSCYCGSLRARTAWAEKTSTVIMHEPGVPAASTPADLLFVAFWPDSM
jgi:hypothetical protein